MNERIVYQSASLLLSYPDGDWPATLELVTGALAAVRGARARDLLRFCERVSAVPPLELGARYVETFDRDRRRTLHLTYYTDGDTRGRGARLAGLKAHYRRHGWSHDDAELPDFLPVMLEFAARSPGPGGALLAAHRPGLDLLCDALRDFGSDYETVVRAVCGVLPGPSARDRKAARDLARSGPPTESVGVGPSVGTDLGMPAFPTARSGTPPGSGTPGPLEGARR